MLQVLDEVAVVVGKLGHTAISRASNPVAYGNKHLLDRKGFMWVPAVTERFLSTEPPPQKHKL